MSHMLFFLFMSALALGYAWLDRRLETGLDRLFSGKNDENQRFSAENVQETLPESESENLSGGVADNLPESLPSVSVLVCARDEEKRIAWCLQALLRQDYPHDNWEILVADDRSEDRTPEILEKYRAANPERLKIVRIDEVPAGYSAKKHALTVLHEHARHEIVCTTDADCLVQTSWLKSLVSLYRPGVDMILGHSSYAAPGILPDASHWEPGDEPVSPQMMATEAGAAVRGDWLWGVQNLDFVSHGIVAAGSTGMGHPINSNANNFSYRREAFAAVGGYKNMEEIISGDDDLLLHKFLRRGLGVEFCVNAGSWVWTQAQESLQGVWNQRKRWASKTIYYTTPTVLLLTGIFTFYTLILVLFLASPFVSGAIWQALFFGGWKTFWDWRVMKKGARLFGKEHLMTWFPQTAFLHIPGIVGAVLGGYLGSFSWKGRETVRGNQNS